MNIEEKETNQPKYNSTLIFKSTVKVALKR